MIGSCREIRYIYALRCTSESYRAPEMVDMFLVKEIDEKPDCWVCIITKYRINV